MKKIMKTILCVLMAAVMVFSFAACSSDKGENTTSTAGEATNGTEANAPVVDDAAASKAAVEGFMAAFCKFDFKEAKEYVDADASIIEDMPFGSVDEIKEQALSAMQLPAEMSKYEEQFVEMFDKMIDKMTSKITYEIGEGKQQDAGYVYPVTITTPDFDVMSNIGDAFGEEMVSEVAQELLSSGTITESSTQDELMEALMPKLIEKAVDVVDEMLDEGEKTSQEGEVTVENKGGKWLITNDAEMPNIGSALGSINFK